MKKDITFSTDGIGTSVGVLSIKRMLPNRFAKKVGPFVFLDYVMPAIKKMVSKRGMGAHPHRGIATLTYILQGELEHFDSAGNTGKIYSGGVQWMKAGNGIIHDESLNYDSKTDSQYVQGFQFWINLPAKNKAEKPEHIAVQAEEVPVKSLPNNDGWIKVIVGSYEALVANIPDYSEQFLYHIHLEAGKTFSAHLKDKLEVAAFLPSHNASINDKEFHKGDFVDFDILEGEIELKNTSEEPIDILLFGGEEYTETVVSEGPFVMNSPAEIAEAYRDFHNGKYGEIHL